jgi:2,3-bisphosphoglycerate-independent phosphoglycerate mutase
MVRFRRDASATTDPDDGSADAMTIKVKLPDEVANAEGGKIVFLVMDGLGGLPDPRTGRTELEAASTPNLDTLAKRSALGLHRPTVPGIAPGSGPGHLALFGYDPLEWNIGRGVLSALGVDFDLQHGDVAARMNLATLDGDGNIVDRRAGRPPDEENRRLVAKLRDAVSEVDGVKVFFESEKEHRVVLVLRGEGLSADLSDTDPQETGVPPLPVEPLSDAARDSAELVAKVLDQATAAIADEPQANGLLARGFAAFERYPGIEERFKLKPLCIARYPMYRGVARLLGMDIHPVPDTDTDSIAALERKLGEYDFVFVHFKYMDSRGEDGDHEAKQHAIEAVDALIPRVEALNPDVLVVTGDHSTPATYRAHSWHPVPVLIASKWTRTTPVEGFGERECLKGELGIFEGKHLMSMALAHAGRLAKFGA